MTTSAIVLELMIQLEIALQPQAHVALVSDDQLGLVPAQHFADRVRTESWHPPRNR